MITLDQVRALSGRDAYGPDGDKIGSVGQVWEDGAGAPTWASVRTGLFGLHESLVPLQGADVEGDRLVLPFDKAKVKDAPNVDASHDEPLTQDDVERLYEYYGLSWQDSSRAYEAGAAAGNANYTGTREDDNYTARENYTSRERDADFSDRATDYSDRSRRDDDGAMTRSEERLQAGTQREEAGRARLRKYVVTENEQVTVPVEREEVRLEREPITDANRGAAFNGPDITESEHEVTLHADRPVVDTEAVPVERVRLGKETVTDEETVSGEVRKERIEADLPDEDGRRKLS
ncbi:YsnF/AvaK domain-containing protein [Actinoplanes sp. NPDC049596]|uniref:YsnF/AvaK domain-containing protein n=1 Tax=unclassified Actinoplanes TaxID=2626549 RepID=UPI0034336363